MPFAEDSRSRQRGKSSTILLHAPLGLDSKEYRMTYQTSSEDWHTKHRPTRRVHFRNTRFMERARIHLKCANYVLLDLPKGLKFLRAVSAKESSKIMGLKGIHDPEALWHFASLYVLPVVLGKTDKMKGPSCQPLEDGIIISWD